jgi:hypothetical protein
MTVALGVSVRTRIFQWNSNNLTRTTVNFFTRIVDVSNECDVEFKTNRRKTRSSYNKAGIRLFSTSGKAGKNPFENTYGLTYSISPDVAMEKFTNWAHNEQGLNSILMNPKTVQITAAYCPVWSFDLNIRFILSDNKTGRKRLDWKPDIFSAYGTQSIVHLPGLSAYAGYSYRRSLIDPLHNTALVFLGEKVVPFGSWMLRDMKLAATDQVVPVIPDPWNAPKGRAIAVVKEGLESLSSVPDTQLRVQMEVVTSRRVYMPTYAIKYMVLGME